MSADAVSWAFRQDAASTPKFVLVAIAEHANPSGVAFPGQQRLAAMTGFEVSTVVKSMKALEVEGIIGRAERRRRDNMRTSDWIVLAPRTAAKDRSPLRPPAEQEHYPDTVLALFEAVALTPVADNGSHDFGGSESVGPEHPGHIDLSGEVTSVRSRALREEPPEENRQEEQPPQPPKGGRRRDREEFEAKLLDWAQREYPSCSPAAIAGYAKAAIGSGAGDWATVHAYVRRWHGPAGEERAA